MIRQTPCSLFPAPKIPSRQRPLTMHQGQFSSLEGSERNDRGSLRFDLDQRFVCRQLDESNRPINPAADDFLTIGSNGQMPCPDA